MLPSKKITKLDIPMNKSTDSKAVTFQDVERVASDALSQGVKPTVRGIMKVIGGRTETVSDYLNAFNNKREQEQAKIADEIGTTEVGKLLAGELYNMVERKTKALNEKVDRQKEQIEELIELLGEKEADCQSRVDIAEIARDKAIQAADEKVQRMTEKLEAAENQAKEALEQVSSIENESQRRIEQAETKAQALTEAAKSEASALVNHAEKRILAAETESKNLRDKVSELTLGEAKHQLQMEQLAAANKRLDEMEEALSEAKTQVIELRSERNGLDKDVARMDKENEALKVKIERIGDAQSQLIEAQKIVSQLQRELSQSERERESLSQALAANSKS